MAGCRFASDITLLSPELAITKTPETSEQKRPLLTRDREIG